MKHRVHVAPAARRRYTPGELSQVYQSLDQATRKHIAADADELFVAKTGVRRKLDEKNPADRILVRQWLLIRDAVIAIHRFEQVKRQAQQRNLQAELQAELVRSILPKELKILGLPEELSGSLLMEVAQVAHVTVEVVHLSEIFGDIWPHFVAYGVEAIGPWASVVGPPLAVIAGLMEIAEAHEVGDRKAERNAFIWGFASHLVYRHIINPLGRDYLLGQKQILGEKAAIRFLNLLPPDVRIKFLARYRGQERYVGENTDKAISDLGYWGWK